MLGYVHLTAGRPVLERRAAALQRQATQQRAQQRQARVNAYRDAAQAAEDAQRRAAEDVGREVYVEIEPGEGDQRRQQQGVLLPDEQQSHQQLAECHRQQDTFRLQPCLLYTSPSPRD